MVYVCRTEFFNAAHKLYNPQWSEAKNKEVFGPCANENWHGHDFELIVTVKGVPAADTGYVIDLKWLGQLIKTEIIEKVHQRNLNDDVDFLKGKMPSCEILAMEFWHLLANKIVAEAPQAKLHCIELIETRKNSVKYYGE